MKSHLTTKGFGLLGTLFVALILVIASLGWYVWSESRESRKPVNTNGNTANKDKNTDPYEGWKSFSNTRYGVTFKYPNSWKVDEGAIDSSESATKQEYAINLKHNEDVKYNDTVSLEVLGENMSSAAAWYDDYFAQSAGNHVSRSFSALKGRPATSYSVANSGITTKLYLLSVNGRTYAFSSVNEFYNVQADSSYWTTFDKIFESLKVE